MYAIEKLCEMYDYAWYIEIHTVASLNLVQIIPKFGLACKISIPYMHNLYLEQGMMVTHHQQFLG